MHLFIFAWVFLGKMVNWYEIMPWWDSFVHFISGILLAIGSLLILKSQINDELFNKIPAISMATYTFFASTAAAALWEIWEFSGDQLFGLLSQGNSLTDTMIDICMGTGGAVIAAVLVYFYFKHKKFNFIGDFIETFSKINRK